MLILSFEEIKNYCVGKPKSREDFPFGPEPLVIKVVSKIFAIINVEGPKLYISLKCDPFMAQTFRQQYSAVKPGFHLNKQHWNTLTHDGTIPDTDLKWMIDHSYDLVCKTLSKTQKESL